MPSKTSATRNLGVSGLQTQISLPTKSGALQHSIATCKVTAQLKNELKIDLASEISQHLQEFCNNISPAYWQKLLREIKEKCKIMSLGIEISFPYFVNKKAPISDIHGMMEYSATFTGNSEKEGLITTIAIPITTLCPCSKEISNGGAHNQRAEAILTVQTNEHIWLEDLIETVEESASCPVYSVLKRPDEKYVTERAFENPMFVEDVVRKIATKMTVFENIDHFSISVESFESIHKHNAYAFVHSDDLGLTPN